MFHEDIILMKMIEWFLLTSLTVCGLIDQERFVMFKFMSELLSAIDGWISEDYNGECELAIKTTWHECGNGRSN